MELKLKIKDPERQLLGNEDVMMQAASAGVEALLREHLEQKNQGTAPNRYGLPKSNYYSEAAKHVESEVNGKRVTVEVDYPGIALHYEGGTVYPKKKALAVPINPAVAGIWPSEYGREMFVVWPKGKKTGLLVGADANDEDRIGHALYLLLPKANIPEDKSVLPTDEQVLNAAEAAIWEALS